MIDTPLQSQDSLYSSQLFDLSVFKHKAIFEYGNYPWDALGYLKEYLLEQELGVVQGDVSKQAYLVNPDLIQIGIGTVVEPGAYIEGPCVIGNYCTVRHGAYVRGTVLTGDHCVIGHATEVKGSIFLDKAQAAHFSYVGDSILGQKVNLGAGAKLANLLFKKETVKVSLNDESIDTQRRKLGAIIGDGAQVGCNSVTNPGTVMGKNACLYPCTNAGGVILKDHTIRSANELISYPQKKYATL